MISRFARIVLFVSSYAPLMLAFAVLYLKDAPIVASALIAVCVCSVLALRQLLRSVRGSAGTTVIVGRSGRKDTETLSYLATYLVPFALAPPRDVYAAGALTIFVAVLAYLYITTNMIYINPALSLFGYHIYEVAPLDARYTLIVLSRFADELPERFQAVEISHRIYIVLP